MNTLPLATLDAFRDHGEVKRTVDAGVDEARQQLADLEQAGISIDAVTSQLLTDGIASFQKAFDTLLVGLEQKSRKLGHPLTGSR